ncbi:MAG: GDSL-type esterase/lipase family protein [Polyangiaceae bacterium]
MLRWRVGFAVSCFAVVFGCSPSGDGQGSGTGGANGIGGLGGASTGGGATSGGATSGGSGTSGGANQSGGVSSGGSGTSGGASAGGATSGGGTSGGASAGGASSGGGTAGGAASGGGASGGAGLGGARSGGATSGGASSAGSTQGGATSGGAAQGGSAQGGSATGGSPTSGSGGAAGSAAVGVRILGRTATGSAGQRFAWPGVGFYARFSGTQASIQLNDGNYQNSFEVVVDGGTPRKFTTSSGTTSYSLASGLAAGDHDVVVWRSTEVLDSGVTEYVAINGFSSGGALLAPAPAPERRIEIIGDSISAGAGILGTSSCTSTNKTNTDNYYAYGSVAARALKADVVTIAWSGIGIYRNYNEAGPSTNTMPQRYDYAIPTDKTAWDFSKYQPHVVVINLTSNDFSTKGDPGAVYVQTYVDFVKHVRSKYANAYFMLVIEWSTSDTAINNVVTALKQAGETKVEAFDIRPSANSAGCAGHPDKAGGEKMGNALAARIRTLMSWQ